MKETVIIYRIKILYRFYMHRAQGARGQGSGARVCSRVSTSKYAETLVCWSAVPLTSAHLLVMIEEEQQHHGVKSGATVSDALGGKNGLTFHNGDG